MNDDTRDPDAPSDDVWLPIRASLRDVAVPADAREGAIAAALAEFDALHAVPAAAAATAPSAAAAAGAVVSLVDRRQQRYRWLTGAAAAIVVLAVGGLVASNVGRSNDDGTNVAIEPASAEMADAASQSAATQKAAPDTGVLMATAETMAPAAGGQAAATESTAAAAESTAPVPTIGSIDGAAEFGNAPSVETPEQLAAFAASVPESARQPTPVNACLPPDVDVLGQVVYRQQQALVVRAPTGQISAIERLSCAVLVTVGP